MKISMPSFNLVPQFPRAAYEVNHIVRFLAKTVKEQQEENGLDIEPDFQREHVWTMEQRIAWIEYLLRGGEQGQTLIFNQTDFYANKGDYTIVDGKQRLTSLLMFLRDEVPVFGYRLSQFDRPLPTDITIRWRILALPKRSDVLAYYLAFNAGGTPHTKEEIERVRKLYDEACKAEQRDSFSESMV